MLRYTCPDRSDNTSLKKSSCDLRHADDREIQPVPGVSEEGEWSDAEPPSQDLYERLKGVDPRERISGKYQCMAKAGL